MLWRYIPNEDDDVVWAQQPEEGGDGRLELSRAQQPRDGGDTRKRQRVEERNQGRRENLLRHGGCEAVEGVDV